MASFSVHTQLVMPLVNLCGRPNINQGVSFSTITAPLRSRQLNSRNHVPWAVIAACNFAAGVALVILRFMLATENKKRENETYDDKYDKVYITDEAGVEKRVDRTLLDLTDKQNRSFRYVL
jgi:hypothetical protein